MVRIHNKKRSTTNRYQSPLSPLLSPSHHLLYPPLLPLKRIKQNKRESELVAGYQTEHSALSFAFFFLGEYSAIILISTMMVNFFWGGYSLGSMNHGIILGVKVSVLLIIFILCRATLPRLRFDQLMSLMWTCLLPLVLGYFIFLSSVVVVMVN